MGQYLPIVVMVVLAFLFAFVSIIASRLLNPPRPTPAKISPYECGIVDQTPPPERFPVRFFLVAMIFIIVDIEIIFLYPYTAVYQQLGAFGILAVAEFSIAVLVSFTYLIANGGLDWGPAQVVRRSRTGVDPARTSTSTVRRVGLEGRAVEPADEAAA
jgi:NADH-quinone oxidoreductase subunit A